jgi:hypothetical protein
VPTPGTQRTAIRIEPELWERFGELAPNRSAVLREFIKWYVMAKGAKRPTRPLPRLPKADADHD